MYKKNSLSYKKERAVLSDVLPYEIPLTFSNRFFYDFLVNNLLEYDGEKVSWKAGSEALDSVISMLFGVQSEIIKKRIKLNGKFECVKSFKKFEHKDLTSIPFNYSIVHQENRFRELSIPHPKNQIQIVDFYNEYKEIILYYSSISNYSIRYPTRVSRYSIKKSDNRLRFINQELGLIEEDGESYDNIKSFFAYKKYSNIYKFYESKDYHECEKKYNKMLKIDVTRCFDSVYTHSIAWAVFGKGNVKEQLVKSRVVIEKSFPGKFDKIMQSLNYNETNGIVIGPELSRIFAEIILQKIDRQVYLKLSEIGVHKSKDYEIFRYVDDYFVFFNEESVKNIITKEFGIALGEFKLSLNPYKEVVYEKPLITEITIAKNKISKLLTDRINYDLEELIETEEEKKLHGSISFNARKVIVEFKTIIKESGVGYDDILNYTLAVVEGRLKRVISDYIKSDKKEHSQKNLIKALLGILEYVFFVYSVSPKVNVTIKLSRVLNLVIQFCRKGEIDFDYEHMVLKSIFDEICFLLNKNKSLDHAQVETLYLLIVLAELGKVYWLDESLICRYMGIEAEGGKFVRKKELNHFAITVLLFYIKNKKRYSKLREFLVDHISERLKFNERILSHDAESIYLLLDSIACPFIELDKKRAMLSLFGVESLFLQEDIINLRKHWFTKWTGFNLGRELDIKKGDEVY
ncbi:MULTISPECIES: antiviral reverse transcriptase Drt3b [unclassified Halomonas]|uniref:antiviral reverse transcriptase Drt3b n=1 Tax=unclassified Halomonas TaxID=2609666 RepID=UPI0009903999|nr:MULTISPECIES: antiviral reverse transcriptase Drt3b [unclassified Halomonas]AQU81915.1 hypothetical protein B2G49_04480 [Halomonas sp. 'Soap Lake \